ncbi:TPA: hypothetical protein ACS78B_000419 [Providencia alcalifaciens]|uniref:hypothetical protein n=1 Tax=Providencia alcalifaciens TaxID=126385 RepID=UPI001CC63AE8|nr:hypothetical protein [Providencia alcalifaciens]CAG9426937.1 hypothetical protein NVI2019_NGLDDFDA_02707 [Providencia alcalifaciens]
MNIIIGFSNFSFECYHFNNFDEVEEQFSKLKRLQDQFKRDSVTLSLANDILDDQYFGHSLRQQFDNFSYGKDRLIVSAFISKLHREYFSGFNKQHTGEKLKEISASPDVDNHLWCALYAPNGFNSADALHLISTTDDFYFFYEYLLGNYPINEKSYYTRAKSHFKNIEYHADCEATLSRVSDGFCNYSIAITQCLRALNDSSPFTDRNFLRLTRSIGSKAGYDCTPQGHSHKHFQFKFEYNGHIYPNLNCNYHLKPSKRNNEGDTKHYHKRIYFGFIPINESEYKIAIAAIGPHISTHDSQDRYAPES